MSEVPNELKYLSSHEWARVESDGSVTVGITDHAQDALGDVVFVELPDIGTEVTAGEESGVVESVKAASDIFSPISGEVIAINERLAEEPEVVNSSPYDDGWFYKLKVNSTDELSDAMDAGQYREAIDG